MTCFVYLIGSEGVTPSCKIGVTKRPGDRVRTLQCGNPWLLWVEKTWKYDTRTSAEFVERVLHRALDGYRVQGEWFSIDCDAALKVIGWVLDRLDAQDFEPDEMFRRAEDMLDEIMMEGC